MQPLERAVAIFCIACICAELTTQLAGSTWARRCIKAVAGLYILVVFARTVPQAHVQLRAFLVPVQEPVSIASPETSILAQTQAQLEQTLAEQWYTKTGREASVAVMLKETDSVVAICSAQMTLPANCTAEERQQAGAFLQEKLQLLPEQIRIAAAGEETARTFGTEEVAANPAEKAEPCTACIGSGLHRHGAHFAFRVVPGKSPGGTAGCISGGGYLQNTAGAAADRADRAGTGSRKDHWRRPFMPWTRSRDRPRRSRLMCCWTTGPHWNKLFIYRPSAVWRSSARAAEMSGSPPASQSW